ncbi:MAG: ABC transporter ATP-binding protein/permease [Ruminococcus sp.]|nr:ABC transporter ATP-binding protein/permease [Ruminococcus sp.]
MLQLKEIRKVYGEGDNAVQALGGVSITFRESEFVAILGHSGCGKTTLLNIIGGLDHYTSGDLIINGVSTKQYRDRDWDAYRNHSIGFIFQSYNLIPHQTVLSNVELALTISGVSRSERRKRAKEALEKVGLGDQLHKKPNQMSGGQMQRVAIARALINDPDILLADEPTGALDSETSIQVMELLKEIAQDKLVVMVTHNPELAEQYATRIVRIKDGLLTDDSDPYEPEKTDESKPADKKRVSMSFGTAVSLSMNNLMTKKGRTLLTAFAGSIGIIGIALILALSTGINRYIDDIQEETLSSYPLQIYRENTDTSSLLTTLMQAQEVDESRSENPDKVYSNTADYEMFNSLNSSAKQINNMKKFKEFIDSDETIQSKTNAISYTYDVKMPIFTEDPSGDIVKTDFMEMYTGALGVRDTSFASTAMNNSMSTAQMSAFGLNVWEELLPDEDGGAVSEIIKNQYDLVYGSWCENYDEAVIVLTKNNEIPDIIVHALGIKEQAGFADNLKAVLAGETIDDYGETEWSYEEIAGKSYKLILPCESYQKNTDGTYTDLTATDAGLEFLYSSPEIGTEIKITGFIRPNEDAKFTMINGYVGYTSKLTEYVINKTNDSDIVKEQMADESVDVITGAKFLTDDYPGPSDEEKIDTAHDYMIHADVAQRAELYRFLITQPDPAQLEAQVQAAMADFDREQFLSQIVDMYSQELEIDASQVESYIAQLSDEELMGYAEQAITEQMTQQYAEGVQTQLAGANEGQLSEMLSGIEMTDELYLKVYDEFTPLEVSESTYEDNLRLLGSADMDDPSAINLFCSTFEDKDEISDAIKAYNDSADEKDVIHYTDFVKLLMSSVTSIISGISYLLIAFVGISLVVSSIMIGIITYISVLERTREIGILRAIGASKHNVSTVFNAETLLVGLVSGLIGIGVSILLTFPINYVIHHVTSLDTLEARLPAAGAVILVVISMVLTLIAGLIPSRVAAKKDPVEALRTE